MWIDLNAIAEAARALAGVADFAFVPDEQESVLHAVAPPPETLGLEQAGRSIGRHYETQGLQSLTLLQQRQAVLLTILCSQAL